MTSQSLTPEILAAALQGLEDQRQRIEAQIVEVKQLLGGGKSPVPKTPAPRRRTLSAAARARIAAAQKKRWAAFHSQTEQLEAAPKTRRRKRKMSAAGRKAIAEAAKKRWAEFRQKAEKAAS